MLHRRRTVWAALRWLVTTPARLSSAFHHAGVVLVAVGVALVSVPAGLVVGGLLLIGTAALLGWSAARGGEG
ncbi:hypothetical protein GCM10012275_19330 [Longimycelium tulufanense]|uniref:Uncharacterized protein n=1 Tax=Longimycelium tulufanense TaxID=907463 RepID=A0A8J3FVX8_9PSEU|nr:hypothetical protein [Longimycelium tulufanense]GGM48509.1 hypothetical protein GCM10012275_19330 [Longimycelium tulufanense]